MSNSIFTASNEWKIEQEPSGLHLEHEVPAGKVSNDTSLEQTNALREFFQWERDQQLGRVRYPENTDYLIYPQEHNPETVYVVNERVGLGDVVHLGTLPSSLTTPEEDAAKWWFDNHPTTCGAEAPFVHKQRIYGDMMFQAGFITCDLPAGHEGSHGHAADTWELHWGQEDDK